MSSSSVFYCIRKVIRQRCKQQCLGGVRFLFPTKLTKARRLKKEICCRTRVVWFEVYHSCDACINYLRSNLQCRFGELFSFCGYFAKMVQIPVVQQVFFWTILQIMRKIIRNFINHTWILSAQANRQTVVVYLHFQSQFPPNWTISWKFEKQTRKMLILIFLKWNFKFSQNSLTSQNIANNNNN